MKIQFKRLIDRAGLLIAASVASLLAWWTFRVAGEYVFLAMNLSVLLILLKRAGPTKR
jgi:hypothetical protein